jgi:hypothetical protein
MEELYKLIKSLDSNEKKYFRRFGLKDDSKGDSQSKELFKLLDELPEYDEAKIANRMKRLKLDKQVNNNKSYLLNLLTETMVWYHRGRFPGFVAAFDMAQIQLLDEKGLYEDATRFSARFVKQALATGSFTDRWHALSSSIHSATNDFLADKKHELSNVNDYLQQREQLLNEMQRFHEYDYLLVQQLTIIRKSMQARNTEDLATLNAIFGNTLVQDYDMAISTESVFVFHTIRIQHFSVRGMRAEMLAECEQLIAYYRRHPTTKISTMGILWAYSQLTQACYFNGAWDKLEHYLQQLNETGTHSSAEAIARFSYYTQLAITLADHKKDTQALQILLMQAGQKLKEFKDQLRPDIRLAITITCASAFVEYKQFEQAIDVCEDFLTNYDTGVRLDALLMLYVYEFIAHLETGNMTYVNNTLQNVNRYFIRNDFKGDFESTLLKTFRKLSEMGNLKYEQSELKKLKAALEKSAGDVSNPQSLALLPIVSGFLDGKMK